MRKPVSPPLQQRLFRKLCNKADLRNIPIGLKMWQALLPRQAQQFLRPPIHQGSLLPNLITEGLPMMIYDFESMTAAILLLLYLHMDSHITILLISFLRGFHIPVNSGNLSLPSSTS